MRDLFGYEARIVIVKTVAWGFHLVRQEARRKGLSLQVRLSGSEIVALVWPDGHVDLTFFGSPFA